MSDPLVLSGSSLEGFFRCPKQWEIINIRGIRNPPNVKTTLGVSAHTAVEHNYRQKITSKVDEPLDVVLDVFSSTYDTAIYDVESPEEHAGKAKDSGIGLIKVHHSRVAPHVQPAMVEEPGQLTINGIAYSWVIDLVDDEDIVRDLKTTMRSPDPNGHWVQVVGYATAFRQRTGRIEKGAVLDYLVRASAKKAADYVPVAWAPFDSSTVNAFASQVRTAHDMMLAGHFPATGVAQGRQGPCSWCGVRAWCPAGSKLRF